MRFGALRLVVGLQIAFGSLFIIGAVYIVLVVLGSDIASPPIRELLATPIGLVTAIALLVVGVTWIAFAQLIQVVMQIEVNTRKEGN